MFRSKPQEENGEELGKIYCTSEIQAAFILSSVVTFFSGLVILFICRLIWKAIKKWKNIKGKGMFLELLLDSIGMKTLRRSYSYGAFRDRIEMLLSAQTFVGQVLVILVFVLSIGSLIIYFINSNDPVRSCSSYEDKTIPIDLVFNAFFSFYFGLRFLAADDKIKFWLEMNSVVDIFTIPPTFISYYLKSNWLGLRFLRALRLLELPRILQILQAIKTSNSVKFSKLLSIALTTWFTAAGFIHLVENSGDPWLKGRNSQNISYFDSIYLVMATTSTVGFGDVVARTSLGRTFIMFFTLGSLVLIANYMPEMVELFANKRKYTQPYEVVKGKKFIVVCGNITVESVTAFLRNFLRHKPGQINIEIVFLGEAPPSLELETVFKCYVAYTTFVSGSALKWNDLQRVAVECAEACLIIANPLCNDWQAEDTSNIMRVLSIKNYYPQTRVIIQILQSDNKVFLPKIPSWNWNTGDNIICFAELKLGFLAQGCLVPGLCTFLTSLFVEQNKKVSPKESWQKYILNGLKNKILTQRLSDDFAGMSFPEVSRGLILNPPAQVKLHKNTLGFFIAESLKEVKRAFFYCSNCHSDVHTPDLISKCACRNKSRHHPEGPLVMDKKSSEKDFSAAEKQDSFSRRHTSPTNLRSFPTKATMTGPADGQKKNTTLHGFSRKASSGRTYPDDTQHNADKLDSSGMYHWCKSTPLDKVIVKRIDKSKHEFRNHIVACIFGDAQSALIGLQNFVKPLRASNYTREELKDIVFIGSLDYMQREWRFLRNFPQIYILSGSALNSGDLSEVNIEDCSMCAILAPPSKLTSSHTLVDMENIMATLNIGSLRISIPAQMAPVPVSTEEISPDFNEYYEKSKFRRIPILTELKNPSNIHFIEQIGGLEGNLMGTNLHLSTSFATGSVFSGNFLDSLLATPRKTFGQLFCGSLDNFGILCIGLYRMIDDKERNPELKRFVITRPANEFCLLPSDLVFCAIPFSTAHNKKNDTSSPQSPCEIVYVTPLTPETHHEPSHPPRPQPAHSQVQP